MHVIGIFDLYNLANRDLTKANTLLLILFRLGRSKIVKLLDRIQSIYGRTMCSLINKVNLCRARLLLGWVTMSRFNSRCGTFISACNQPPRSTQPGHPFVGRRNEYQLKGGDALRLRSNGRYGLCVWQVKLCNISTLETQGIVKRYINSPFLVNVQ